MSDLELGVIGNCAFSALIDRRGRVVWCCLPRVDGDPVFHSLLGTPAGAPGEGMFEIALEGCRETSQAYDENTAILRTRLDGPDGSVEITDIAPRFFARGRTFRPLTFVRRLRAVAGNPRIAIRLRPRFDYGTHGPQTTHGSNHIRYVGPHYTMRLTTNAPIDYVRRETPFLLDEPLSLILGPDETLNAGVEDTAREFEERTADYWRTWSRRLAIPYEWQEAVIRAAITLKLCTVEETGAIVAALTTSIPESPNSGRNWDYRYCWLRDAFFVVRAFNSLSEVGTMETYLRWLNNVVSKAVDGHLQPVYGVGLESALTEWTVNTLPGYRSMGPVRVGNQACEHFQHDVYGNVVLGAAQSFIDRRLHRRGGPAEFARLEQVGERAFALHREPDAGMWELRSRARVHTSSSLMSWAACDRLAKIADALHMPDRQTVWRERADIVKAAILDGGWNAERGAFVESFGGKELDASILLMAEVGFLPPDDPRFVSTVERIEEVLGRGPYMLRYEAADDFGMPETAFNICTFWRIDALARIGRAERAREIFEAVLASRNHLGLLSEDTDPVTGELWGNFPQTYSMVGIINCARRLSRPWEAVV